MASSASVSTVAPGVQVVGELAELRQVHLGVLVLAEVVLQRLELADERLARLGREEAAEALEQVAELLGVLAQVVEALRRRGRGDGAAVGEHRVLGLGDALAPRRARGAGRRPAPRAGSVSHARQLVEQLAALVAAERAGELGVGRLASLLQLDQHAVEAAAVAGARAVRCSRPSRGRRRRGRGRGW